MTTTEYTHRHLTAIFQFCQGHLLIAKRSKTFLRQDALPDVQSAVSYDIRTKLRTKLDVQTLLTRSRHAALSPEPA